MRDVHRRRTDVVEKHENGSGFGDTSNQLGLSPAFFAKQIALFGVFRHIKARKCNNRSEAAISRFPENVANQGLLVSRGISGKTDPMCDCRLICLIKRIIVSTDTLL